MTTSRFDVKPFPRARHDIVDGAQAARFAKHLRELVEGAEVLADVSEARSARPR